MSSFKKALQTRSHKERSQPAAREHLGLLEKKKDYILRARDFHSKEKKLKQLREKAAFRNPDEFYFKMENTITRNGVHSENRNEKWDPATLKLLKTQDQNYVNYMRSVNLKKMDKLKESLHIIDDVNEQEQNSDEECKASKHVIFVDTEKDAKKFNAAQHFNTLPEFVDRKFNRPTLDILKNSRVLNAVQKHGIPKQAKKEKAALVRELASRVNREEKLLATKMEMDTQKNLMGKGPRKKVKVNAKGLAVYKWKQVRST